jgi:hypothetical protein
MLLNVQGFHFCAQCDGTYLCFPCHGRHMAPNYDYRELNHFSSGQVNIYLNMMGEMQH